MLRRSDLLSLSYRPDAVFEYLRSICSFRSRCSRPCLPVERNDKLFARLTERNARTGHLAQLYRESRWDKRRRFAICDRSRENRLHWIDDLRGHYLHYCGLWYSDCRQRERRPPSFSLMRLSSDYDDS